VASHLSAGRQDGQIRAPGAPDLSDLAATVEGVRTDVRTRPQV